MRKIDSLLDKYFWGILSAIAMIFLVSVAKGATWGLPGLWHPDERLHLVLPALKHGLGQVSEAIYYPSLPFFTMFAVGKTLSLLTTDDALIAAGIRVISAMLGAIVIVLTAKITLTAAASRFTALVAAILVMLSSGFVTIAHHAIVDIYLTTFVALASFLLLVFIASQANVWLFLAFFTIGLAASSKYNGGSLLVAANLITVIFGPVQWRSEPHRLLTRILLANFLALLGFFIGTPRAILHAPAYLEQLPGFLERQRIYMGPTRSIGIIGQWKNTLEGLGLLLFLLFALATIWGLVQAITYVLDRRERGKIEDHRRFYLALLLILIAFELPIALSQFYPIRYMVPAYPLLAVLSAWMLRDLWLSFQQSGNELGVRLLALATIAAIFFSALRIVSVMLYFANDSRFAAADYLQQTIRPGSRTEYTSYPPHIPTENRVVDNYPMVVFKFPEEVKPHTGANMGEDGIEIRRPDYLVLDRKTFSRFEDEYVCRLNHVECEFFARLLAEETNYRIVRRFEYRVPPYLPEVQMDFVNVDVLVLERRAEPERPREATTWRHPLDTQFGEHILLQGYDLQQTAENQLQLSLFWATNARMAMNYKVFVHCLDSSGQIVAQSDDIPAGGSSPTEYWLQGEIIRDDHNIVLPKGSSAEDCQLEVGLYQPEVGERLPARLNGIMQADAAIPLQLR